MSKKKYDLAVVIGRFQINHMGHHHLIMKAQQVANKVLVVLGTPRSTRTTKNPFTYEERSALLKAEFPDIETCPVYDSPYSDQAWMKQVQFKVQRVALTLDNCQKITLVGYKKDISSYYLELFTWDFTAASCYTSGGITVNSTEIRNAFYEGRALPSVISDTTAKFLEQFKNTAHYRNLCEEHNFIKTYKQQFASMPYPPFFVTTDAVVICNGHILMVKRSANPSKGSWALPGGFLENTEWVNQGIIRELVEETSIRVNENVLKSALKQVRVFDDPNRSLRGRTITHAGLIVLHSTQLPAVKPQIGEVEKVKWIPIHEFENISEQCFEDHWHIGMEMISSCGKNF